VVIARTSAALLAIVAAVLLAVGAEPAPAQQRDTNATPVYAYYYIWFDPSSWNRAKTDYPLLGRYSSDQLSVMREHVRMAQDAGIDGFLVSWKSTPTLNPRLEKLIGVARSRGFRLAIIYQGLDFERRPLPIERVEADLDFFARRYAPSPVFRGFGKPVVVWSGTWEFTPAQIERVTSRFRDRLLILGSEKHPEDYLAKAALFDGDAYYWSSVDPRTTTGYAEKLRAMGDAVHSRGGLWFAPAAPGFDAGLIGGTRVVGRRDGETLRELFDAAQASNPDAVGLISFNEFSENSHVEPSRNYGTKALEVLADIRGTSFAPEGALDSSDALAGRRSGPNAVPVLAGFGVLLLASMVLLRRDRRRRARR
jgi:hypothetical protein